MRHHDAHHEVIMTFALHHDFHHDVSWLAAARCGSVSAFREPFVKHSGKPLPDACV